MKGLLALDAFKNAAAQGSVDTVTVGFPDLFGRLMGKRFHVDTFIDLAWSETHACNSIHSASAGGRAPASGIQVR